MKNIDLVLNLVGWIMLFWFNWWVGIAMVLVIRFKGFWEEID